jgi:hypothetical protein
VKALATHDRPRIQQGTMFAGAAASAPPRRRAAGPIGPEINVPWSAADVNKQNSNVSADDVVSHR